MIYINILILIVEICLIGIYIYFGLKNKTSFSKKNLIYFVPILIIVFINYCLGYFYKSQNKINFINLVNCFNASIKAFVFDCKGDYVINLINESKIFYITFIIGILMASYTLISSIILLIDNKILNSIRLKKYLKNQCDIILYNKNNDKEALRYIKQYHNTILWIENNLNREEINNLIKQKIVFINTSFNNKNVSKYLNKSNYNLISFLDEKKYIDYIKNIKEIVKEHINLSFFFEINNQNKDLILNNLIIKNDLVKYISLFSRYELIARKFIIDNPMSLYMNRSFINNNFTIKNEVEINQFIIGFGHIGEEIYHLNTLNNQFACMDNELLKAKPVNYYIFDSNVQRENNFYFNYDYTNNQCFKNKNNYFDLIEKINNKKFYNYNAFDLKIIDLIIEKLRNEYSFSFITIAIGSDLENIKLAQSIIKYIKINDLFERNFKLFVRIENDSIIDLSRLNKDNIYTFGNIDSILNDKIIVNDELSILARKNNNFYNEKHISNKVEWKELSNIKKYSNIYSSINTRFKLNLMNLDYLNNKNLAISIEEYYKIYGEKEFKYDDYKQYFKTEARNTLAYIEHLRWCSYYVMEGYLPYKKSLIKFENNKFITKDEENKYHACLTSYYGLKEYDKYLLSISKNKTIEDIETYKYDYQVMDNVYNNLKDIGLYIIKK